MGWIGIEWCRVMFSLLHRSCLTLVGCSMCLYRELELEVRLVLLPMSLLFVSWWIRVV